MLGASLAALTMSCGGTEAERPFNDASDASSEISSPETGADTSAFDTIDTAIPVDANVCNALPLDPPNIQLMDVAEPAPVLAGGIVPDASYFLIKELRFTGASGGSGPTDIYTALRIDVAAGNVQFVEATSVGQDVLHTTYSTKVTGNTWQWTDTCANPGQTFDVPFEMAGTNLRIGFPSANVIDELEPRSP